MLNFILACRQLIFTLETLKLAPNITAILISFLHLYMGMVFSVREGSGLCARECLSVCLSGNKDPTSATLR